MKIEAELGLTGSEEELTAAQKIQAMQRGKAGRRQVASMKIESDLGLTGSEEETAAIAKMQAMQRGKMSRKELAAMKMQPSSIANENFRVM